MLDAKLVDHLINGCGDQASFSFRRIYESGLASQFPEAKFGIYMGITPEYLEDYYG
jgi:hypothetical protein